MGGGGEEGVYVMAGEEVVGVGAGEEDEESVGVEARVEGPDVG